MGPLQRQLAAGYPERAGRPTPAEIEAGTDKVLADARGGIAMINAMVCVEVLAGKSGWAATRRRARLGGSAPILAAATLD